MSQIDRLGPLKPGLEPKPTQNKKPLLKGDAFESQLLKTVQELESMDQELDKVIKDTSSITDVGAARGSLTKADNMIRNITGLVEDFSRDEKIAPPGVKYAAGQYEKMSGKNKDQ